MCIIFLSFIVRIVIYFHCHVSPQQHHKLSVTLPQTHSIIGLYYVLYLAMFDAIELHAHMCI